MRDISVRLREGIIIGSICIVESILLKQPELLENADLKDGRKSLHLAAYYGHDKLCGYLLNLGHDSKEVSIDIFGCTPLHLAAEKNHTETVFVIAQKYMDYIDLVTFKNSYTALLIATKNGFNECVSILLDFGASINKPDKDGNRPLHYAAAYGNFKLICTLVERGADFTTPNNIGFTPMQYCFSYQVKQYLSTLIDSISNKKKKDSKSLSSVSLNSTTTANYTINSISPSGKEQKYVPSFDSLNSFNRSKNERRTSISTLSAVHEENIQEVSNKT